ncbi:DUF4919 domain-containing protein [Flammeovirga sp. OC4]|uniref:DUF4919 domain-containing protein n=1 Tax=Flammeovirga sp. OC4 TaxID=1382345 RepID=UPI0005C55FF7|nr:DUF4919 domain-containing protein [Flammeovirga sp. OC4]
MKAYFSLLLLNCLLATSVFSQTLKQHLDVAYELRETKKYNEAIALLDSLITIDSVSAEVYYLKGSCYHHTNLYDLSVLNYQTAIAMDSLYSNAIYNLANSYESLSKMDSAELYFRRYIELDSGDAYGYMRLGNTLRSQGKEDSVMYFYEKAYAVDSVNLYAIYTLAQEYFILEDVEKYNTFIEKGKALSEGDVDFYLLEGALESENNNYEKVVEICEEAMKLDSTNFELNRLYIESVMLQKTDPKAICKIDYRSKFVDYNNEKLQDILADINEDDHAKNMKLMKEGTILSLEDYFRFYLSQKNKPGFSAYFSQANPNIDKCWEEENYEELVKYGEEVFDNTPLRLSDLYRVCSAHYSLGNIEEFRKYYAIYFGILEGMLATGNGTEPESAYIVITVSDEYAILNYLGMSSSSQALVKNNGHSYDILTGQYSDGEEKKVYFNVDVPLTSLNSSFTSSKGKNKKKKNKKKRKNK